MVDQVYGNPPARTAKFRHAGLIHVYSVDGVGCNYRVAGV